jgi:hypothetical protein
MVKNACPTNPTNNQKCSLLIAPRVKGEVTSIRPVKYRAIAAERNAPRIVAVLPRWRRAAGLAAYGFAGLMAAWAVWFVLFMGAVWLGKWCWRPYRETQERLRHEQTEILRAIEGTARGDDST